MFVAHYIFSVGRLLVLFALANLFPVSFASAQTLEGIKSRGTVNCGVSEGLEGFSFKNDKGDWAGFDVDFCRAISAAIFDDPSKVHFVPLNAAVRFAELASGKIDILSRNSTWNMAREVQLKIHFPAVTYYDGQGFLIRESLQIQSSLELIGAKVCVQTGTNSEQQAAEYSRMHSLKFSMVVSETVTEAIKAYESGRCAALSADTSQLHAMRVELASPSDHKVLPGVISKEPLGPAVRQGDEQWAMIVKWVHFVMLNAEEAGISSKSISQVLKLQEQSKKILDVDGSLGRSLGLADSWAVRIIERVGNYGESFERNLGPNSKIGLARGHNQLWSSGGLQYGPPMN